MADRADPPGLRFPPLDTTNARQLTEHYVQSTAIHSRSRGWLPRIKLDLHHRPLVGEGPEQVLELIISEQDLKELSHVMNVAMVAAMRDAQTGLVGSLPGPSGGGQHRGKKK